MSFLPEPLKFSESVFVILRDLIHERTGLYYEDTKRDLLADKLSPRVIELGLSSLLDYYYLLKYDAAITQEWKYLINLLSVPETFFWREIDQIKATVNILLPQYLKNRQDACSTGRFQPIRIWSAACSTGEEPLTIAMALNEAGWFERYKIEICASDASETAIAKAKEGIYRSRSFRNLPPELKAKYFTEERDGWRVSPLLNNRIRYQTANLFSPFEVKFLARANFIFCRNVFIYFSQNSIRQTALLFFQEMPTPGYLFLSSSESLLKLDTGFELEEVEDAFVYVKK
jgi:chemotaxis protein methyltransferase CheR